MTSRRAVAVESGPATSGPTTATRSSRQTSRRSTSWWRNRARTYAVRIRSDQGEAIDVVSRSGQIEIPLSRWQRLLSANRGRKLYFDVCVRRADGQWTRFEPIVNTIADADIDRYLFYRLMKPIYIVRVNVAIYQRDLRTYEESVGLEQPVVQGRLYQLPHLRTPPSRPDDPALPAAPGKHPTGAE